MSPVYWLVEYGRQGFIGAFTTQPDLLPPARGTKVCVRSPRGQETGLFLGPLDPRHAGTIDPAAGGEYLGEPPPLPEDPARREAAWQPLIESALAAYPVLLLDLEWLPLEPLLILHVSPWDACELDPALIAIEQQLGLPVRVLDLSQIKTPLDAPPRLSKGCGSGSCGSGSCGSDKGGGCGTSGGCSSRSCSRGQVRQAEDLTAYFAELRKKMESETAQRRPLI